MTKYKVFRKVNATAPASAEEPGGGGIVSTTAWEPLGDYEATDGKGAVRAAVLAMPEEERQNMSSTSFAACASSSWQELAPKVKVETAVSF